MLFVVKGGIIVTSSSNTIASSKLNPQPSSTAQSLLAYAIAISIFFPFMLFHSTNAAPTMLTAAAATLT